MFYRTNYIEQQVSRNKTARQIIIYNYLGNKELYRLVFDSDIFNQLDNLGFLEHTHISFITSNTYRSITYVEYPRKSWRQN